MGGTTIESKPRFLLPVTLLLGTATHASQALVDSGAEQSLIDKVLAKQLNIPLFELESSIPVKALDNQVFSHIIHPHPTAPFTIVTSGNHRERLPFLTFHSPSAPIILGFTWLNLHNPHLDWVGQRIMIWSPFCHATCLVSAPPSAHVEPARDESTDIDISVVPLAYHDLREGFNKDKAQSLPLHRPCDCAIDF